MNLFEKLKPALASLKNKRSEERLTYEKRNELWSVMPNEESVARNQEYYEAPDVVDAYDIVGYINGEHQRKRNPYGAIPSFQLLELAQEINAKKFLDVGCGAGFFKFLLQEYYGAPIEKYVGLDISSEQIKRARSRYSDEFRVEHAGNLTADYIRKFDIVHLHSVLNFMAPDQQMNFLENLLASKVPSIINFSITERKVDFCPNRTFKNLGSVQKDGQLLLSQIGFCHRDEIEMLLANSTSYEMKLEPIEFSVAAAYNNTSFDGAFLLDKKVLNRNAERAKSVFGTSTLLRAHKCVIWPKGVKLSSPELPESLTKLLAEPSPKV